MVNRSFRRSTKKRFGRRGFKKFTRKFKRHRFRQPIHRYKRTLNGCYDGSSVVDLLNLQGGGGPQFYVWQFKLNDLPGISELISLYDQYKINAVKVQFIPQSNIHAFDGETIPFFMSVIDYDDSTNLGGINDAYEYESLKTTNAFQYHSRYLKPRFMNLGTNTAGVNVPINARRGWISTAQSSIVHRGVKSVIDTSSDIDVDMWFRVKTTYYLSFRNVK